MRTILLMALLGWCVAWSDVGAQTPSCAYGPGALSVDTLPPGTAHGDQLPIDHIVVMMQENRSYDHYFGKLRRKSGPPRGASNPDPTGGDPIKRFHTRRYCEVAELDHSWNGTHREFDGGAMDGFAAANVDPDDPTGSRTMGYYTARDLPYYYKLYRKFASADRYFCSVLSQTFPNRYYLLAGTSFGEIRNNFPDLSGPGYTARTIFNLMDEASPPVAWKIYYSDLPFGAIFGYVRQPGPFANLVKMGSDDATNPLLVAAATQDGLPQVAFVDPSFVGEGENDEHPPTNVQEGQAFAAKIIDAIMNGPNWSSTVIFLTYDEHGGYYDHVPPPPPARRTTSRRTSSPATNRGPSTTTASACRSSRSHPSPGRATSPTASTTTRPSCASSKPASICPPSPVATRTPIRCSTCSTSASPGSRRPRSYRPRSSIPARRTHPHRQWVKPGICIAQGKGASMSIKVVPAAIALGVALVGPAMAGRLLGFERNTIVVAPWSTYGVPAWYPPYPPYLTYAPGAYFRPPPLWSPPFYGTSPEYVPGANWRDNWYDATRTKVHGYTLR